MKDKDPRPQSAVILFAHGARDPAWAEPLAAIRAVLTAREPALPVELAFLELMTPLLPDAIDTLAARGVRDILIVPVFLARGGHLKRDLPALVEAARGRHPQLSLRSTAPIGEAEPVIAAIADYALQQTGRNPKVNRP